MKNLGLTIDRLIKIDPQFEEKLLPIRGKWEKFPSRTMTYWKQLIDILNSEDFINHPQREEIRKIVISKRKPLQRKILLMRFKKRILF